MSRREIIIVATMVLAILAGAYLHFMPASTGSSSDNATASSAPAIEFTEEIVRTFKADTSLTRDLFAIRSAEDQWGDDPFIADEGGLAQNRAGNISAVSAGSQAPRTGFLYTGFLEVGRKRLAIINGLEYARGESIDDQGHYVRRIDRNQVELGKRNAADVIVIKLSNDESVVGN